MMTEHAVCKSVALCHVENCTKIVRGATRWILAIRARCYAIVSALPPSVNGNVKESRGNATVVATQNENFANDHDRDRVCTKLLLEAHRSVLVVVELCKIQMKFPLHQIKCKTPRARLWLVSTCI